MQQQITPTFRLPITSRGLVAYVTHLAGGKDIQVDTRVFDDRKTWGETLLSHPIDMTAMRTRPGLSTDEPKAKLLARLRKIAPAVSISARSSSFWKTGRQRSSPMSRT